MILNLSAYRFVDLDDLPARRARLRRAGEELGLRGTVLLAPEGINLFASGPEDAVEAFMRLLEEDPPLAGLQPRRTWSEAIAFDRWRVRLKREIITLRQPAVRPRAGRAPAVSPATLERWLQAGHDDEGREIALVDTRNRYEVEAGSFAGAIDPGLNNFGEFPAAIDALRPRLAGRRVVTFCTGGIRCEKAALWMDEAGFEHVVQLDGGVLGYFEAVGGRHWEGGLFVFDKRETVVPVA
ncbi:rhodanese-like domain-containing protein [Quisquiliibacterium transsilvanicum]|uniref:UPF0176 protein n=1 Tax=Quisquiliibacterium transsilvanicum TaxID=1549638 RepID=A0A7W8HH61_9BURK|nr:rhodanese-like domain-containing protein [Quisquiliibacterium transsilvanicum]MBB5271982.1 UPF0176 protein [Quisquiliibacterium transsilvanicum]